MFPFSSIIKPLISIDLPFITSIFISLLFKYNTYFPAGNLGIVKFLKFFFSSVTFIFNKSVKFSKLELSYILVK